MKLIVVLVSALLLMLGSLAFKGDVLAQHDHLTTKSANSPSHSCPCPSNKQHSHTHTQQHDLKACKYCGMDREKYSFSKMQIEYEDGSISALCSLHCAAIDLSVNIGKSVKSISVGDYNTKKLTNAERAFWVVGGSIPGVMTKRAKWAFANELDAKEFIKANGGKIVTFEEALKSAYEDMYEDTKMIRQKRQKMKMSVPTEHKH